MLSCDEAVGWISFLLGRDAGWMLGKWGGWYSSLCATIGHVRHSSIFCTNFQTARLRLKRTWSHCFWEEPTSRVPSSFKGRTSTEKRNTCHPFEVNRTECKWCIHGRIFTRKKFTQSHLYTSHFLVLTHLHKEKERERAGLREHHLLHLMMGYEKLSSFFVSLIEQCAHTNLLL